LGCALICVAAAGAYGQQKSNSNDTSLGTLARQMRAQKAKEPKPVLVITNDNLPAATGEEAKFSPNSKPKASTEAVPAEPKTPAQNHDEAYFRSRMSSLQESLSTHQRELSVLEQKLGQNQEQYYPDPNKALQQEYSRSDIDKLTGQIDAKKAQIAADEQAIDDLHDELRRDGGNPGWLRD
jgi:predicted RNase H-like nuclease (RuvC/YqgF family)